MDFMKETVKQVMESYTGKGHNGISFLTSNPEETVFSVVTIADVNYRRAAHADLIVRLLNDKVIIEADTNDKTLLDALLAAGMPREKIVLTYAGEITEEAVLDVPYTHRLTVRE